MAVLDLTRNALENMAGPRAPSAAASFPLRPRRPPWPPSRGTKASGWKPPPRQPRSDRPARSHRPGACAGWGSARRKAIAVSRLAGVAGFLPDGAFSSPHTLCPARGPLGRGGGWVRGDERRETGNETPTFRIRILNHKGFYFKIIFFW